MKLPSEHAGEQKQRVSEAAKVCPFCGEEPRAKRWEECRPWEEIECQTAHCVNPKIESGFLKLGDGSIGAVFSLWNQRASQPASATQEQCRCGHHVAWHVLADLECQKCDCKKFSAASATPQQPNSKSSEEQKIKGRNTAHAGLRSHEESGDTLEVEVEHYETDCGRPCTPNGCMGHVTDIPEIITINGFALVMQTEFDAWLYEACRNGDLEQWRKTVAALLAAAKSTGVKSGEQ